MYEGLGLGGPVPGRTWAWEDLGLGGPGPGRTWAWEDLGWACLVDLGLSGGPGNLNPEKSENLGSVLKH